MALTVVDMDSLALLLEHTLTWLATVLLFNQKTKLLLEILLVLLLLQNILMALQLIAEQLVLDIIGLRLLLVDDG